MDYLLSLKLLAAALELFADLERFAPAAKAATLRQKEGIDAGQIIC